jgi:hypothetical protein
VDRLPAGLRHRALHKGFAWPDGKFRFKPDWKTVPFRSPWLAGPVDDMPVLPDHWEVIEEATAEHPFRLGTSPARNFPQLDLQRNADLDRAREAPERDDPPG